MATHKGPKGIPGTARPVNADGASVYYLLFDDNGDGEFLMCPNDLRAYAGSVPGTVECDVRYRDEGWNHEPTEPVVFGRPLQPEQSGD